MRQKVEIETSDSPKEKKSEDAKKSDKPKKGVRFGNLNVVFFDSNDSPDQVKQDLEELKEISKTLDEKDRMSLYKIKTGVNGKPILFIIVLI